jgi:2-methylcitrate dehydratase PrpD
MSNACNEFARFAIQTKWEDLPQAIVQEAKYLLLDVVGCALAGLSTGKGKMAVELARKLGGPAEATVIGTSEKVSCSNAALANGDLIMILDYCPIVHPGAHIPPFVIPTLLAVGENNNSSGKDLILSTVIGHEIPMRIASALPSFYYFEGEEAQTIKWRQRYGYAPSAFGAAAGASMLLKLDEEKMTEALGIAGHLCQIITQGRFSYNTHRPLTKYAMAGWQNTGSIMAVLLAQMGHTGDTTILEADHGFWEICGYDEWRPDRMMNNMGREWFFSNVQYKMYPCCGVLSTSIDCFVNIVEENSLMPEEIENVTIFSHPSVDMPLFLSREIKTIVDVQFCVPYLCSVVAHRVKTGIEWQDPDTMKSPKILGFMDKVVFQGHPEFGKHWLKDFASNVGMAEVKARGKTFKEERVYARGTPGKDPKIGRDEIVEKFRHNASRILPPDKIDGALKAILELETVKNISELMYQLTP